MTGTALVPYVQQPDNSPAALRVRDAWSAIRNYLASRPLSEPRGNFPPHRMFTPSQAVGLQVLQREYAAATRLTLVGVP